MRAKPPFYMCFRFHVHSFILSQLNHPNSSPAISLLILPQPNSLSTLLIMPKHPNLVIVIRGNMQVTFNDPFRCVCGHEYSRKRNLRRHILGDAVRAPCHNIEHLLVENFRTIKNTVYTCSWYTAIQLDEPAMSSQIVAPPQSPTSHYSGSSSPSPHYSNHGDSSPSPPAYHYIEPSPPSPAPPPPTTSSGPDTIASPASPTPPSPSTCAPEVEPTTTPDSSPPSSTCTPEVESTTTSVSSSHSATCSPSNVEPCPTCSAPPPPTTCPSNTITIAHDQFRSIMSYLVNLPTQQQLLSMQKTIDQLQETHAKIS
ncbi:MAG: hypothetical protein J3R72DRAFT_530756 [Linnemannia gamsii]|nr:MAG: hypothetical protein J3R72DRAFT_530756 [Linnemannia gamsii]